MSQPLDQFAIIKYLGVKDYAETQVKMQEFNAQRDENTADEIWFLEHPAVFTLGTNSKSEHLLNPENIPVVQSDRGGQVTYHAPGQLIAYVMIDVKRKGMGVRQIVTALETAVIKFLAKLGIEANADPKAPGVYVDGEKIAALGLRFKQKGCYHGLSLNVEMDLSDFDRINPCGYSDLKVTSLKKLGRPMSMQQVTWKIMSELCLQLNIVNISEQKL
ncbi:MAG: octanoyltransferase [endosymbiont of Galathealinum brachiosum]|uniref:Octanoyltransferase n=1 Tax=endosymbiont of Galathealinum brachiosum TaxID=2200906 RepID=A0A370DAK9_9GAMM|nr:MAG: octanoyltransferase [endosymbiont of Galathealinum brachiosum]